MCEWITDKNLRERLVPFFQSILNKDDFDPEYERIIREEYVFGNACNLQQKDIEDLEHALINAKRAFPQQAQPNEFAAFFLCFEWYNRKVHDTNERRDAWTNLFLREKTRMDSFPLFHYAFSRYYIDSYDNELNKKALEHAQRAVEGAPNHIGFVNNKAEILLSIAEAELFSTDNQLTEGTRKNAEDTLYLLKSAISESEEGAYPSYYVSCGRLEACLGNANDASNYFAKAKHLAMEMHEKHHPRMDDEGEFVSEIGKIVSAESNAKLVANIEKMRKSFTRLNEESKNRAGALDKNLKDSFNSLDAKMEEQKVNMIEFLGFFAGVISFIVAAIQIGADMDFTSRALLLIVMLGALLIAFGSLSTLLQPVNNLSTANKVHVSARWLRSFSLVVIGFLTIALGVVLHVFVH